MTERSQHDTQDQKRQEGIHNSYCYSGKGASKEGISCKQLDRIFELLPDGALVCDQDGMIVRLNPAANLLFEVTSAASWKGKSAQQFLHDYQPSDPLSGSTSQDSWLMNLVCNGEAGCASPVQTLVLHMPSGRQVYVNHWQVSLLDTVVGVRGSLSVFQNITHRYQKALHLQRVREATNALIAAVAHLPAHIDLTSSEDMPLLSAPVIFVAQSLVNVVREVLQCRRVSLVAFPPSGQDYLVAGSGLTPEQEQYWQQVSGRVILKDWIGETAFACLSTHQVVVLTDDNMHRLPPFLPADGTENLLLVPLFLEQQWVGVLVIVKANAASLYTPDEIELVKAVAAQTLMIIECLIHLNQEVEGQTRALIQYEIHRLSDDFLTLASHELLTPLTTIFGNIQLAQRRLEALKRQVVKQPERVPETIEHALHSLDSASQGVSLQNRMIHDLIDDAQIQTKQFKLHLSHFDLLALLKEAVAKQQQSAPKSRIILQIPSTEQSVPILVDAERITRVLNTYLTNALSHSPSDELVTVQLVVADSQALVSVSDQGPGISIDQQEHLWERFYRAKGSAVQHELDLSLGLGFYLCRAIIEQHHGHVGVQSAPGKGETFWFSLPVVASPEV